MAGLLSIISNATKAVKNARMQRSVERKISRAIDASSDSLERQREAAVSQIEGMFTIEALERLDKDEASFDVSGLRKLRATVIACEDAITENEEMRREIFVDAPEALVNFKPEDFDAERPLKDATTSR